MLILIYKNQKGALKQKKIFFGFKDEKNMTEDPKFKSKRKEQTNPLHPHFW
jgi:hypothetical protein